MADTIDQQFIEYIVKTLVSNPDKVKVSRSIDERGVLLELYVEPEDLGRVIGRNGATAKSIRTLLRALGVKNDARYNLKIIDTNSDAKAGAPTENVGAARREGAPADTTSDTADDQAAQTTDESPAEEPQAEAEVPTEEPAVESAPEAEEESSLDRHRREIEELTKDT